MHPPSLIVTVLAFLLLLGPLIVLHELGHYLVGRCFGVRARAFSIGFGHELLGWTDRRGTRWKIAVLPLGGYVQFEGDANAAGLPAAEIAALSAGEREGIFWFKPLWQRTLIVLAGPVTNLLVAFAIFFAFNLAYGRITPAPVIAGFADPSPARAAGLRIGDRIVAIDGAPITSFDQIREKVWPFPGDRLQITAARGPTRFSVVVPIATSTRRDAFGHVTEVGQIGIAAGPPQILRAGPWQAARLAVGDQIAILRLMVIGIDQIIEGRRSVRELGGPVRIAQVSGEQLALGWADFVYFVAFISMNLAFINLLPIPTLDGGHLAFYAAEALRGRPVGLRGQEWAFRTGLALVLCLMLFVTANDLASLKLFG
ncbi:MAG: site-2 protease family protein [Sphingomonadales bacterium]|nr:site-2 protease family protein [Sphingomonadales bacterium]